MFDGMRFGTMDVDGNRFRKIAVVNVAEGCMPIGHQVFEVGDPSQFDMVFVLQVGRLLLHFARKVEEIPRCQRLRGVLAAALRLIREKRAK